MGYNVKPDIKKEQYAALDVFRIVSAFLVVSIHTSVFYSLNNTADFILTRIIARIAVPYFFMLTGYFMYKHIKEGDKDYIKAFLKKIGVIYLISILIYLPLNIYSGYFKRGNIIFEVIKDILFDGTFYHLWYLPAVMTGVLIVWFLIRKFKLSVCLVITSFLYMAGLFGDSYYGLVKSIHPIESIYRIIFNISDYTRNGIFFAPVFILLGAIIREGKTDKLNFKKAGFIISFSLLLAEGLILYDSGLQRHDSMYIMLIPVMIYLFTQLLSVKGKEHKSLRNISLIIYIIHPWMIVFIRGIAKIAGSEKYLVENSIIHYVAVCIVSWAAAFVINKLLCRITSKRNIGRLQKKKRRAWIDTDLSALKNNVKELKALLPEDTNIMAVVKANAYGHGDVQVCRTLNKEGIKAFAVASLTEGIRLRKKGIRGEILILGYTPPRDSIQIKKYRLTQRIVDSEYGGQLNKEKMKIKVQIQLDTGMHRLGIDCNDIEGIKRIYNYRYLKVCGIYSHLCVSDSLSEADYEYTVKQIKSYNKAVEKVRKEGYNTGKLHIQASYGILNYQDMSYDYVRAGIALYGVMSDNKKTRESANLIPVLSLRALVETVKEIKKGETVGYGRRFTAERNMKIASVSIGYADGIPGNFYEAGGYVLIREKKAQLIGRVCMDRFMIDVTDIKNAGAGDIVTLIGKDGSEVIRCEDFAERADTISNEILSGLGRRLPILYN